MVILKNILRLSAYCQFSTLHESSKVTTQPTTIFNMFDYIVRSYFCCLDLTEGVSVRSDLLGLWQRVAAGNTSCLDPDRAASYLDDRRSSTQGGNLSFFIPPLLLLTVEESFWFGSMPLSDPSLFSPSPSGSGPPQNAAEEPKVHQN